MTPAARVAAAIDILDGSLREAGGTGAHDMGGGATASRGRRIARRSVTMSSTRFADGRASGPSAADRADEPS